MGNMDDEQKATGKAKSGKARMRKMSSEERTAFAKAGASARWNARMGAIGNGNGDNNLRVVLRPGGATPQQPLPLDVAKQIEIDGIGMGVLITVYVGGMQ